MEINPNDIVQSTKDMQQTSSISVWIIGSVATLITTAIIKLMEFGIKRLDVRIDERKKEEVRMMDELFKEKEKISDERDKARAEIHEDLERTREEYTDLREMYMDTVNKFNELLNNYKELVEEMSQIKIDNSKLQRIVKKLENACQECKYRKAVEEQKQTGAVNKKEEDTRGTKDV